MTDPRNREFLNALARGDAPQELVQGATEEIQVALVRRGEDYRPPEKKTKAFTGKGRTLCKNLQA